MLPNPFFYIYTVWLRYKERKKQELKEREERLKREKALEMLHERSKRIRSVNNLTQNDP